VHPQFERLAMAYTQYQSYAAAGGWEKLKGKRELKKGKSGTQVLALRERLKAEGYDVESEAPQVFGGTLRAALKTYQLVHYLRVTGILEEKTRKSLNIPVESRLESIGTTLWKWRSSRILDVNVDHVFVNISGFTGQLWRGGKREHEFKVAVGKRKKFRDKSRQWVYPNATPELHSEITHVVVNPKWNIPSKIFKEEILPKIEKDPFYAEEHHYILTGEPGAYKSAYQSSGPWNALGKVKFVFSNSEAIFLHDTPGKRVFRRAQRAASHGCIRVEGALDLAQMILEPERRWKKKYREEEENPVEKWIGIKAALPVFLESYTVTVGDKGAVYFGSDLYKRETQLREEYLGLRASHSEKAAHAPLPSSGD
jgi:murein L,D-transpeptidase YcbB/YkuD